MSEITFQGQGIPWISASGTFGFRSLDPGAALLLDSLEGPCQRLLDLGCGNGTVGVLARLTHRVESCVMTDVSYPACRAALANVEQLQLSRCLVVQANGASTRPGFFDQVALNPPIRAGRTTVLQLFREAHASLEPGGRLLVVGRIKQGIRTLATHLETLFGETPTEIRRHKGFRVLRVHRRYAEGS